MRVERHNLIFNNVLTKWDEALAIGNGTIGALIYNDNPLRFSIDRMDLWDNRPAKETSEKGFNYNNLISLANSKSNEDFNEHNRLFDYIYGKTTPTKITAGSLSLRFSDFEPTEYRLDLLCGAANIKSDKIDVNAICSKEGNIGIINITGGSAEIILDMPEYLHEEKGLNYPPCKRETIGNAQYILQETAENISYGIFVYSKFSKNVQTIVFTVAKSIDVNFSIDGVIERLQKLLEKTKSLKQIHELEWRKFWQHSEVCLPDDTLEKNYYLSNYYFASTSAKGGFPMPLQGVWTADNGALPPWKGDYHHDLNTQMSYSHCFRAGHFDEGEAYTDYLWNKKDVFERFAKQFYGVDGILIPAVSSLDGAPLGGWPQYSFSPTMSIWCIKSFEEYYSVTYDRNFLISKAYPYFKGVATAIQQLLQEKNGKLFLPLSTSPEIHNNSPKSYLVPNTNNDLALLKYLFTTLIKFSKELEYGYENYAKVLSKLEDYHVISGALSIDKNEELKESHRHHSHLMGIYPLKDDYFFTAKGLKIFKNSMKNLSALGVKEWVGFSFTWASCLFSLLGKRDDAVKILKQYCSALLSSNGFHLNGDYKKTGLTNFDYRPFTLESNMGFCDAVQNLLLFNTNKTFYLFNGICASWLIYGCSFSSLHEKDGLIFSASIKAGRLELIIDSPKPTAVNIIYFGNKKLLKLNCGQNTFTFYDIKL